MIVGLAGPVTNFLIAIALGIILNFLHPAVNTLLFRILFVAFQVNIVLGVFNLIPIPPLDGSRVIGGFMSRDRYERWIQLDRYGIFFILLLFIVLSVGPSRPCCDGHTWASAVYYCPTTSAELRLWSSDRPDDTVAEPAEVTTCA